MESQSICSSFAPQQQSRRPTARHHAPLARWLLISPPISPARSLEASPRRALTSASARQRRHPGIARFLRHWASPVAGAATADEHRNSAPQHDDNWPTWSSNPRLRRKRRRIRTDRLLRSTLRRMARTSCPRLRIHHHRTVIRGHNGLRLRRRGGRCHGSVACSRKKMQTARFETA